MLTDGAQRSPLLNFRSLRSQVHDGPRRGELGDLGAVGADDIVSLSFAKGQSIDGCCQFLHYRNSGWRGISYGDLTSHDYKAPSFPIPCPRCDRARPYQHGRWIQETATNHASQYVVVLLCSFVPIGNNATSLSCSKYLPRATELNQQNTSDHLEDLNCRGCHAQKCGTSRVEAILAAHS